MTQQGKENQSLRLQREKPQRASQFYCKTPKGAGIKRYQEQLQTEVRHGNENRSGWKSEQEVRPFRSPLCPQTVKQYPSPAPEENRRFIF